jgi:hypothetical protein
MRHTKVVLSLDNENSEESQSRMLSEHYPFDQFFDHLPIKVTRHKPYKSGRFLSEREKERKKTKYRTKSLANGTGT